MTRTFVVDRLSCFTQRRKAFDTSLGTCQCRPPAIVVEPYSELF